MSTTRFVFGSDSVVDNDAVLDHDFMSVTLFQTGKYDYDGSSLIALDQFSYYCKKSGRCVVNFIHPFFSLVFISGVKLLRSYWWGFCICDCSAAT